RLHPLSLHDALPILPPHVAVLAVGAGPASIAATSSAPALNRAMFDFDGSQLPELRSANREARMIGELFGAESTVLTGEEATEARSEEHTSELQSQSK